MVSYDFQSEMVVCSYEILYFKTLHVFHNWNQMMSDFILKSIFAYDNVIMKEC